MTKIVGLTTLEPKLQYVCYRPTSSRHVKTCYTTRLPVMLYTFQCNKKFTLSIGIKIFLSNLLFIDLLRRSNTFKMCTLIQEKISELLPKLYSRSCTIIILSYLQTCRSPLTLPLFLCRKDLPTASRIHASFKSIYSMRLRSKEKVYKTI